jgi:hypothetical protein
MPGQENSVDPKPYEVPVIGSSQHGEKLSTPLQAATIPEYEEIDDAFALESPPKALKPNTLALYDDTVNEGAVKSEPSSRNCMPHATAMETKQVKLVNPDSNSFHAVKQNFPQGGGLSQLQKPITNSEYPLPVATNYYDSREQLSHGIDSSLEQEPEYAIPPPSEYQYEYGISSSSEQDHDYTVPPPSGYHSHAVYDHEYHGFAHKEDVELPPPPPRRHSSTHDDIYTPMDAIQSQLQHHHIHAPPNSHGRVRSISSSSDAPNDFSLEDLTKEQLLTYLQIIHQSQPTSYLQSTLFQQQLPPVYNNLPTAPDLNERSSLYVNTISSDIPPPLPPKPRSTDDLIRAVPALPPRKGIPKSRSVLLPGSSAEAVRQRYQYSGRNVREGVQFRLAEEDEDEEHPPVPPRHQRTVDCMQQFQGQTSERPRSNVQRSQTMRAYLPSSQRECMNGQARQGYNAANLRENPGPSCTLVGEGFHGELSIRRQPTPGTREVQSVLGESSDWQWQCLYSILLLL